MAFLKTLANRVTWLACVATLCGTIATAADFHFEHIYADPGGSAGLLKFTVSYGGPPPAKADLSDPSNWEVTVYYGTAGSEMSQTLGAADLSNFDVDVLDQSLTFDADISAASTPIVHVFMHYIPSSTASGVWDNKSGGPVKGSFYKAAKGKNDADIYLSGALFAEHKSSPQYQYDLVLNYSKDLGPPGERGKYGAIGLTSSATSAKGVDIDPDSILASLAYWYRATPSTHFGLLFTIRPVGGEFSRKDGVGNFAGGMETLFWIAPKYLDTHTYTYLYPILGFEAGKNLNTSGPKYSGISRPVAGANFGFGIGRHQAADLVTIEGQYRARMLLTPEPFSVGKADPILSTKTRHYFETEVSIGINDYLGFTAKYEYGSLPPLFNFVDSSVSLGFTFKATQKNSPR